MSIISGNLGAILAPSDRQRDQQRFEAWILSLPRKRNLERYPYPKPGHFRRAEYKDECVQWAWDGWRAALGIPEEMIRG